MTGHIDTATLRDWLEQDRPVTVLDVRTDEDRGQWAIPGSVHLNAYDALRKGEPGLLQDAILPPGPPVVTVCNADRRIPATPPNFSAIVELNEAGELPEGDPTDLEAGANRCAMS